MELRPYSLAENYLLVHFVGIEGRSWFAVSAAEAERVVEILCFHEEDVPPVWIKLSLADGSIALLSRDHISMLTHTYEFWPAEGPPERGVYGVPVSEEQAGALDWAPVQLAIAVEELGILDFHDQTSESADTIPDTVMDGFIFAPFVSFTDDDGERTVVATERIAFVVVHPSVL